MLFENEFIWDVENTLGGSFNGGEMGAGFAPYKQSRSQFKRQISDELLAALQALCSRKRTQILDFA